MAPDLWAQSMDDVNALDTPSLSVDQQLEILKIRAPLAIAQNVSQIPDVLRHSG